VLAHQREAFGVVQQRQEIDQVGSGLPLGMWRVHQGRFVIHGASALSLAVKQVCKSSCEDPALVLAAGATTL